MPSTEELDQVGAITDVAVLGGGLIGQSWAALFLAGGATVTVFDPEPSIEARVHKAVHDSWPVLTELGLATGAPPVDRLRVCGDAADAVRGAQFVQESIPEVLHLKHELYRSIEPELAPDAIVASSASGLTLSELQLGWLRPDRFVLGHPFNPPHLIPLVEVMGNHLTRPGVVERARRFYESVGKVTIEVRKEVPGHIANRLQAALWREAVHLVTEGVGSVEDVDLAVAAGPGIRWATMGPTTLFHLGGGDGGLVDFAKRYTDSFHRWWDDLGEPRLDDETVAALIAGVRDATSGESLEQLAARRDRLITAIVQAQRNLAVRPVGAPPAS